MTKLDRHYTDPRLVEIYDTANPRGIDTDFYLSLAEAIDAHRIIDLGCGTGLLTREFIAPDREIFGVDPAVTMLEFAQRQPSAEKVKWIEGDASALGSLEADLLVMTGNVAQIFLEDNEWMATLQSIHAALRPGGYCAFESRNPEAQGWKQWNQAATYTQIDSPNGPMESWIELVDVEDDRVRFEGHNVFLDTGEVVIVESELRFRSSDEIVTALTKIGFTIEHIYGDWKRRPLEKSSRSMIFVTRRLQRSEKYISS